MILCAVWMLWVADAEYTLAMLWQRRWSLIGRLNWRHWLMRRCADGSSVTSSWMPQRISD